MLMLRTEIFASVVLVGAGISNSYDLGVCVEEYLSVDALTGIEE